MTAVRWFAAAFLLAAGCGSPRALMRDLNTLQAQGQFAQASALVEKSKSSSYGSKNALLYYLDRGMLLHLNGQYALSNQAFEEAKRVAIALFTKSVTTEASTFLVSDNMRPYYGENFERALIHVFSALNYVFLDNGTEALVEARQADNWLKKLRTDYGYKDIYTEDAFVRYLMGLIYENQGEINDAFISYFQALNAYDTYQKHYGVAAPADLVSDALRTAKQLGFEDRIAQIQKKWGGDVPAPHPRDAGEVVVLHYIGLPPHKVDVVFEIGLLAGLPYIDAAQPEGEDEEKARQAVSIIRSGLSDGVVKMAFPKYVRTPYRVNGLEVRAEGAHAAHRVQLAEDVGAIAEKDLQDRIGRVRAKTIARSVIKYALAQKAADKVRENSGEGFALITKAVLQSFASATETADKRCWQTVPDRIAVARVVLPEGEHALSLTFLDGSGQAVAEEKRTVRVTAGRKTFLAVRTAY
jgi:uncharacterized protein